MRLTPLITTPRRHIMLVHRCKTVSRHWFCTYNPPKTTAVTQNRGDCQNHGIHGDRDSVIFLQPPIFVCVCVCRTVDVVVAGPSVSQTSAWVGRAIFRPFPYSTTRLTPVPVTQQRHSTYTHTWHDVSANGVIQAAKGRGQLPPGWRSSRGAQNSLNKNVLRLTTRITIQTAGLAFGGTGLCSYCVRGVDGSCAKHFTVESYTVIYAANSHAYYY